MLSRGGGAVRGEVLSRPTCCPEGYYPGGCCPGEGVVLFRRCYPGERTGAVHGGGAVGFSVHNRK